MALLATLPLLTSALLARFLEARVEGEFDPYTAWLPYDEVDLWALARELRSEFHNDARPFGDALIEGIQSGAVGDGEREMVQADVGAAVERDSAVRHLDLPQGDYVVAVGNERGRIVGPFADNAPSQAGAKKPRVLSRSRTLSPT